MITKRLFTLASSFALFLGIAVAGPSAHGQQPAHRVVPTNNPLPTPQALPIPAPNLPQGDDTVWMTARGQRQGSIVGDKDPPFVCVKTSHQIVSPRDAASGLPTGKRQHKPFVCLTKGFNKAMAMLYTSLVNNENLPEVKFTIGGARATSRVRLTNANIASIDLTSDATGTYYSISFTYQKIEGTDLKTNTTWMDDWEAPVV